MYGNKEAETSQGTGEISLFPLSTKDREMESESGEDPAVVRAR